MKYILVLALLLTSCDTIAEEDTHQTSIARENRAYKGQIFEYKITDCTDINGLQKEGAEGWELCGVEVDMITGVSGCNHFYFKRPLRKQ